VPGYSALFADEEAWMGPWLASFGFVVIGVETTTRTDSADARGTELLSALYDETGQQVRTPYKGRNKPESCKEANRAHARLRGPGERANAQLKTWRVLRKLRCSPHRAGRLAKAIHVLQDRELATG
jgi:hypothetical protein